LRVENLDLAVVGVGDVELALVVVDPQGVLQADLPTDAVHIAVVEQAGADQRRDVAFAGERQPPGSS
jgi:hypothetical protein